jgi:hypothetical protein
LQKISIMVKQGNKIFVAILLRKMSCDTLSPPVSFGDTISNPPPPY